jgi:hypothetical protein
MDYLRRTFSPGPRSPGDRLATLVKQKDDLKDKQFQALARGDQDAADAIGQKLDTEVKPAIQAVLSAPDYVAQAAVDSASVAAAKAHATMGLVHGAKIALIDKTTGAVSDIDYDADQPFQDARAVASDAIRDFNDTAKQATKVVGGVAQHLGDVADDHIGRLATLKVNVKGAKKVAFATPATADSSQEKAHSAANDDIRRRIDALKQSGGAKKTRRKATRVRKRKGRRATRVRKRKGRKASRKGRKASRKAVSLRRR